MLAWTGGETEFGVGRGCAVALTGTRVIDGDVVRSSTQVTLLGEVAHVAGTELKDLAGVWTVKQLPDRTLVVDDIDDTPLSKSAVAHRDALRAKIAEGLSSNDPTYQTLALASLLEHHMVEFVPQVIDLLNSKQTAVARPWLIEQHGSVGRLATLTLGALVSRFGDTGLPELSVREDAPPADVEAWHAWWNRTLATVPFNPAPTLAPNMTGLIDLRGRWSDVFTSPHGDRVAVGGIDRTDGTRGHALVDTRGGTLTWLRPLEDPNCIDCKPAPRVELLTVGWRTTEVGILTASRDDVPSALIVAGRDGSVVEHPLRRYRAHHAALAPRGAGWLLAYTVVPTYGSRPRGRAVWLQALTADGKKDGRRIRLELPAPPRTRYNSATRPLVMVASGDGFALAVETDETVAVVGVDASLRQRWTRTFGETAPSDATPNLVAARGELLLQWTRGDGQLLTAGLTAAGSVVWRGGFSGHTTRTLFGAAATDDGWVLTWYGRGNLGPEIKAQYVSAAGQAGAVVGVARTAPLNALSVSVSSEQALFFSHLLEEAPRMLVRREVDVSVLRGEPSG